VLGSLEVPVLGEVVDGEPILPGSLPEVPIAGFVCSPAAPGAGAIEPGAGVTAPGAGTAAPGVPATPPGAAAAPLACPAPAAPAPEPAACPKAMDVHNARVAVKSIFFIFVNLLLEFLSRTQWSLRDSGHGHHN
jgi:hypothetical protein